MLCWGANACAAMTHQAAGYSSRFVIYAAGVVAASVCVTRPHELAVIWARLTPALLGHCTLRSHVAPRGGGGGGCRAAFVH